ncbi:non-motile and phage-resistance protein [bacterium BMS3Abin06]|nr:non-motile and phage-resistance protein [bacterium BMS3Abin06]
MTIRKRLLLYLLAPLITTILILSTFDYFYSSWFLEKKASQVLLSGAETINNEIQQSIRHTESDLAILLSNRMIKEYIMYSRLGLLDYAEDERWKIEEDFLKVADEKPEYVSIRFIGLDGKSTINIVDRKVSYGDIDFSGEDWFVNALRLEKEESFVSPLHPCKEHNKPSISISRLYYDDAGEKGGVIFLHVHADKFFQGILGKTIGENGYAYLIDNNGVIVAHKDAAWRGADVKEYASSKRAIAGDAGTITEFDGINAALMKKAYMPLKLDGLYLLVSRPMKEITAFGTQLQLLNLIFFIATVLLVSIISSIVAKRISKPIKQLCRETEIIETGNLDHRIEIKTGDEIEHLAASFNKMVAGLKEKSNELRESEEKFRAIFDNAMDGILVADVEKGKFFTGNNMICKMLGYSMDEIKGLGVIDIYPEKAPPYVIEQFENQSGGVFMLAGDIPVKRKDGSIFYAEINFSPVTLAGKTYLMGMFRDITERKKAEGKIREYSENLEHKVKERTRELEDKTEKLEKSETSLRYLLEDVNKSRAELEKANEKLRKLDRLKSMFIASMSHELRTPLNSIIGFTGILLQGMAGEINNEQRDQLQRVYGSAKHLLELITDVIDISKIEAGKIKAYVEEFQLDKVIKEAISSLATQIDNKGLCLETSIPQGIKLTTDRRRLLQCILNYLSNAVKFTEKGSVRISARRVTGSEKPATRNSQPAADDFVEISVTDTGIGIKGEDLPKLFNSFVRLDSPLKLTTSGTGLGLYLTKKLVTEILGGSLSVESKYGEGSTFIIKIPKEI